MISQPFVDLDGVLADFDGHYEKLFGVRPNQDTYDPPDMWDNIRDNKTFYRDQPLMPDAMELWEGCKRLHVNPIILTGIPYSIPNVKKQKQEWAWEYFGHDVEIICCRSVDKYKYMKNRGDILIDDRLKYSDHWKNAGGIFILHTSSKSSLEKLARLCIGQ